MHRKPFSAMPLLVAFALLLSGVLMPVAFLPGTSASTVIRTQTISVQAHALTSDEMAQLRLTSGVYVEGTNYNVIVDGHGTGLAPPTASQYAEMVGSVQVTDVVGTGLMAPASYDLSSQPYFPVVGNQGSQGSCAAWAMTYYDYGYIEARDNGWTDASTGNTAHLLSPAWTYNKVNYGVDRGTFMDNIAEVIKDWGAASLKTMPYVTSDLTSWGSEDAFREAVLHRAASVSFISYSSSNPNAAFTNVKNLISANTPVTFAIDAGKYSAGLTNDNIIVANEYSSTSINHAQTIVGYDDAKTDGIHSDVGAFKVVNSWGKNWGTNGGYYWISYDAMRKIGNNLWLTYITDRPSYQPSLLSIIEFNNLPTRESTITLGVGAVGGTDTFLPYFMKNDASVAATFPSFMAIDMTDLLAKYQSGKTTFYLTLGTTKTAGNVSSFRIEQYLNGYSNAATQVSGQSSDVPKVNPGSATVTMAPYPTVSPATALDNPGLMLTGSGNAQWSPETRDSYSGGSAMQSGNVGNGGKSAIQTTVQGPSTVSFWWKTSTQSTDTVRFYIDDVATASASGVTAWKQVSAAITPGAHDLKWEYSKDASISGNQDLVLLDAVEAAPGSSPPSAPTGLMTSISSNIELNWTTPSSNGGSALTSYQIYRGTSVGAESSLASVPSSSLVYVDTSAVANLTYYYKVTALNTIGESSQSNQAIGRISVSTPAAPTSLTASAGSSYIDLSWSSNGTSLTGFHLYRGNSANDGSLYQTLSSSARSYRDTAVIAGNTYYYRVEAFNDLVSSSLSDQASARIPIIPNAPTSLVATVSGSGVHLAWTAPADNGGSSILGFKVYRDTIADGESPSLIETIGTAVYDDLTATAGTRYYYMVRAYNAIGDSEAGNEASARVPTVPSAPTSLTAVVPGAYIHLSWTAPADNGGSFITQYNIYRGTSPGAESATPLGTTGSTYYDDATVILGTQYYYVVKASNSAGKSVSSNEASSQIVHVPDAPPTPTVVTTLGHVILTWTTPASNGGSPIISYKVHRGTVSDASTHVQIATVTPASYDDTLITVGKTYYYSIKAVNIVGDSVTSGAASALIKGLPGTPSSLTSQFSDRSVVLTWSDPTSNGYSPITAYKIYRSGTSGGETYAATVTGTTYTDAGLVNGNPYYYRVSAMNAMGEGPQCAEVHDSPAKVPSAPVIISVSFSSGSADLAWSSPDNGGRPVTGYAVYRGDSTNFASATLLVQSMIGNVYHDATVVVGSTYHYFVTANSSIGTSSPALSGPVFISGLPSAPRLITPTIVSDHIRLSWSAPASSGSSAISGYCVYRSLVPGPGPIIAHLGNVLAFNDSLVTQGQTYYYTVSAENNEGVGDPSFELQVGYALIPGAPVDLVVVASMGAAALSWSSPVQNGAAITGYTIRSWISGSVPSILVEIGPSATNTILSGLTNGVRYWFSVSASNAEGEGPVSMSAACLIGSIPSPPVALRTSVGNGYISISWEPPASNGGLSDLTYQVWRSTTGSSILLANLSSTNRSYSDRSAVPGTLYHYTLTVINAIGVSPDAAPSHAVAAVLPDAPSAVTVSSNTSSILISWTMSSSSGGIGLTGQKVYRSAGVEWTLLGTLTGDSAVSYRDLSALDGVSYRYSVSAINALGEGPMSAPSASIVAFSAPSAFSLTATTGNTNVSLSWTIPASHGTPLLRFTIVRTESESGELISFTFDPTIIRYIDTSLIPGRNYTYKVTADNAVGSTSTDPVTVHSWRTVGLKLQIVPFSQNIAISGSVTDMSGHGVGDQKVTIYKSTGLAGTWTKVVQLTTPGSGKYSALVSSCSGIIKLRAVLADDGTHVPITIDRTVGSLLLKSGNMASITTNSTMIESSLTSTDNTITFTLEQTGTANISLPKDSIGDPNLIGFSIDGQMGHYILTETEDQYVYSLIDVRAGQIVAMSIGQPTLQENIPILIWISLFMGACLGVVAFLVSRK